MNSKIYQRECRRSEAVGTVKERWHRKAGSGWDFRQMRKRLNEVKNNRRNDDYGV